MAQQDLDSAVKKLIESGASDEDIIFFMQNYKPTTENKPVTTVKSESRPAEQAANRPFFKFPFADKVQEAAATNRAISPWDAFSSGVEAPGIRESIESVPSGMLPFKGLEKMAANFALSIAEGATSPAGAATAIMGGFPATRAAAGGAFRRLAPGLAERILGKAPVAAPEVSQAITPVLSEIGEQIKKPRVRLTNDGNYINLDTGEVVGSVKPSNIDPNFNQGMGNPELAGSVPYKAAEEAATAPSAFIPPQFRSTRKSTPPVRTPKLPGRENREFIDKMPDEAIKDFITRQSANSNYTGSEVGQDILKYAQDVLDERVANPVVNIPKPTTKPATNMTPENIADVETWYKFKKIHDSGKMTEQQMLEWGKVHNRVKNLKPDGTFEIKPNRFDTLPPEESEFTAYALPDGTTVNLSTSATKGAETTTFTLKDGKVVTATKVSPEAQSGEFDPKTLKFDKSNDAGRRGFSTTAEIPNIKQPAPKPQPGKLLNQTELDPNIPITERKPEIPSEQSAFSQIWNTPRSLQSIDLPGITSAALRQSRPLSFTPSWFRAWNSALKSFSSKEALDSINRNIRNSVYFQPRYAPVFDKAGDVVKYAERPSIAEELGVKMTDVINTREEAIVSSLAERIPGYGRYVKASNRAYTGFLNDLRKTKFEQLMDGAKASGQDPETNLVLGKQIADFVNNATGRGSLKYFGDRINLEPIAQVLGNTLYSPRALSARLAFVNPVNYTKTEPQVRWEYWKGLARIGTSWGAFTGLASMSPKVSVSLDANNSDFGKIRIGNTRIDPGAGWQQLMVLFHRELPRSLGGGGTTSSTGRPGEPGKFTPFGSNPMAATRLSLPGRYIYNQLNPSLRFVFDMLSATSKEPLDLTDRGLQMLLPMYAEDIAKAAEDDSATAEFFAPLLSSMGAGVQNYERGSFNKPQITPSIEKATGMKVPTVKVGR